MKITKAELKADRHGNPELDALWRCTMSWSIYDQGSASMEARSLRDGSLSLNIAEAPDTGRVRRVMVMVPPDVVKLLRQLIS